MKKKRLSLATWASQCLRRPIRLKAKNLLSSEAAEGSLGPCLLITLVSRYRGALGLISPAPGTSPKQLVTQFRALAGSTEP